MVDKKLTPEELNKLRLSLLKLFTTVGNSYGKDLPLNSSIYPTQQYIQAIQKSDTMIFRMYWAERQYFSNYFKIYGNEQLELYFHRVMGACFDYGTVACKMGKEGLEIYGVNELNVDRKGDIVSAKIYEFIFIGQPQINSKYEMKRYERITNEDYVFLKFGQLGLTAWWMLLPFLEQRSRIWTILKKNIPATQVKWHYQLESGDPETILSELKWINDVDVNVVLTIASQINEQITRKTRDGKIIMDSGGGIKVEPIILPEQPNAKSYADWEIITAIQNYFTGHIINISTKKERNTAGEVSFNLGHFEVMMSEYANEIKIFLHNFKKKFLTRNDTLEIEITSDIRPLIQKDTTQGV